MKRIACFTVLVGLFAACLVMAGCQEPPEIIACIDASPTIGYSPLDVSFDASCTFVPPERAGVYDYHWSFGDGTDAVGRSATHTFTEPGTYEVYVAVGHLSMGEWEVYDTAWRIITVLPAP